MIRPATHDDLADLVAFCMECHEVMSWGTVGINPETDSVIATLLDLMESPRADLSVVDLGSGLAGVCAVELFPFPWDRRSVVATEWIWHMRPSFPEGLTKRKWVVRMLDYMVTWAKGKGAETFKTGTIHGDAALMALLLRRGVRPLETLCAGRL